MRKILIMAIFLALGLSEGQGKKIFEIVFTDIGDVSTCELAFYGKPPSPEVVDRMLRQALIDAAAIKGTKNIVASAFLGEGILSANQYSGQLIYRASDKIIMTMDQYDGVKTKTENKKEYFLKLSEERTAEGIEPVNRWIDLSLIFPKNPSIEDAYNAMLTEIKAHKSKGIDVNAYAYVGNKAKKTSWVQIKEPDGFYASLEYNATTKEVVKKNNVFTKLE